MITKIEQGGIPNSTISDGLWSFVYSRVHWFDAKKMHAGISEILSFKGIIERGMKTELGIVIFW